MLIYTDMRIAKQRRAHAVVEHDEKDHRWFTSIIECLQYALDQGHTEVTLSDDNGSVTVTLGAQGGPIP